MVDSNESVVGTNDMLVYVQLLSVCSEIARIRIGETGSNPVPVMNIE
jgi:hypothetical protein